MQDIHDIMSYFTDVLIRSSNNLFILLICQFLLIGIFINFFSFWPFFKAYAFSEEVYRLQFYKDIRNGNH